MLNSRHKFFIKKGIRLLFSNPKSLYYKYKQLTKYSNHKPHFLNHQNIQLVEFEHAVLDFSPEIIIPIFNGYEMLIKLITKLLSHQHIHYKLILINDGSSDVRVTDYLLSLTKIETQHSIEVLTNECNLGFVKTVNRGMQLTTNHFIILNTDTEVPTYFANKILQPIIKDDSIASVTPFTNSGTICSFPNFCIDNNLLCDLNVEAIDQSFGYIDPEKYNLVIPTGVGFCMAINKDVYDKIGGFDEETFKAGYCEENDWCMRANQTGYKHLLAVNCFVYHKHGGSFTSEQKQQLITENYTKLLKKYPYYERLVHKFCALDVAGDLRNFLVLKTVTDNIHTTVILNSVHSGGTKSYVNNLIQGEILGHRAILLIEAKDFLTRVNMVLYYGENKFEFSAQDIFGLLEKLNFQHLLVNHLVFNIQLNQVITNITELMNKKSAKLKVIIHDYFYLCPSLNLLNYKNTYCDLPDLAACNKCLNSFSSRSIGYDYVSLYRSQFHDINKWRATCYGLFNVADEISVPSTFVKGMLLRVYADLENKIQVLSHNLNYINKIDSVLNYIPFAQKKTTIATLGGIAKHKSADLFAKMVHLSNKNQLPIEWVVIGDLHYLYKVFLKNISVHDNYQVEDLASLVNKYKVDIFVITSIWPETFCYTASEMMHFNLPVVSFNLGAHAERIAVYEHGHLVNQINAESMLDKIIQISK
jgi:GT2 family glycosyltransferase